MEKLNYNFCFLYAIRRKFIFPLFLLLFIFSYSQEKGKVIGIKDGDTIVVLLENFTQVTIRLSDVDCPESSQEFGKKAKQFTSKKVFGKVIEFKTVSKDRWQRTIAEVYYDNKFLSEEIIKNGFGWWFEKYSSKYYLKKIQNDAKTKKVGLWISKKPIPPWEFRKSNN